MLSRADFIQLTSKREEFLRKLGYSEDVINQLEINVYDIIGVNGSRESYIKAFDRVIANQLGSIVAELN